jgi:hypothetical protein
VNGDFYQLTVGWIQGGERKWYERHFYLWTTFKCVLTCERNDTDIAATHGTSNKALCEKIVDVACADSKS